MPMWLSHTHTPKFTQLQWFTNYTKVRKTAIDSYRPTHLQP